MSEKAARVEHPIGHSDNTLPTILAVGGVVVGVVITVGTAGAGTGVGAVVIAAASYGATVGGAGITIGEYISNGNFTAQGKIVDGARTVYTELQRAAKAHPDTRVDCHDPEYVCTGSSTVFIEGRAASRRGDFTKCGGIVMDASNQVFIGGNTIGEQGQLAPARSDEERAGLFYAMLNKTLAAGGLLNRPTNLVELYDAGSAVADVLGIDKPTALRLIDQGLDAKSILTGP
ncbi:MAG: PAAR domain-containing protein [Myxococcales bacterium]|nr:PAAR domain-containing protein [Myxococcales bacterium]